MPEGARTNHHRVTLSEAKAAYPPRVRVGTVDKVQGREASVVIVSLCASTLDEASRGASFLLSPNRLNVAVSRAEALAIVLGSPELWRCGAGRSRRCGW